MDSCKNFNKQYSFHVQIVDSTRHVASYQLNNSHTNTYIRKTAKLNHTSWIDPFLLPFWLDSTSSVSSTEP